MNLTRKWKSADLAVILRTAERGGADAGDMEDIAAWCEVQAEQQQAALDKMAGMLRLQAHAITTALQEQVDNLRRTAAMFRRKAREGRDAQRPRRAVPLGSREYVKGPHD